MNRREFIQGMRHGIPICLGYFSVSAAFGMMAVLSGIPLWVAVMISLTNVTSAGQFAGVNLMLAGGTYLELLISMIVINIRYFLMSLSLSQKVEEGMGYMKRFGISFGITDEIFAVAIQRPGTVTASYMAGLIFLPVLGWTGGTLTGGAVTSVLPESIASALGIALYGMFIAIVVPAAKNHTSVLFTAVTAVFLSLTLNYMPIFSQLSGGWGIILITVIASALAALCFPITPEEPQNIQAAQIEEQPEVLEGGEEKKL
ncbi:AzlC family ABC transporter permease [Lachnospiraceae bacterium 62-35]